MFIKMSKICKGHYNNDINRSTFNIFAFIIRQNAFISQIYRIIDTVFHEYKADLNEFAQVE